jgi:hypothetical protein
MLLKPYCYTIEISSASVRMRRLCLSQFVETRKNQLVIYPIASTQGFWSQSVQMPRIR